MSEFTDSQRGRAGDFPAEPILEQMQHTYTARRAAYGPSEQRFADLAMALFPRGLRLVTREDWVRYGLLHPIIAKLARYQFAAPHVDSIHDIAVYAAMLEAEDRRALGLAPFDDGL